MTAKKAFPQKSFPATVTFRPDQFTVVRRLQDQRKLSEVCQQAVDLDAELEDLSDGVRDDALEAAAYHFAASGLTGSYAISQGGRSFDMELIQALKGSHRPMDSGAVLAALQIDPSDTTTVRLVRNQLEALARYGLISESSHGWSWRR